MKPEQKIVAIGAASGVAAMALGVWALTSVLPVPQIADSVGERLAYALTRQRRRAPAVVHHDHHGSQFAIPEADAIDPTRRAESVSMQIDGRVVDNTLQQNFVFVIASLALSTIVPLYYLQVVWACVIVFVTARLVFWLGYRLNPLYRAPGMSASAYLNLGMILFLLFHLLMP